MLQLEDYSRVGLSHHSLIRGSPLSITTAAATGGSAFHTPMPTIFIAAAPSSATQQDIFSTKPGPDRSEYVMGGGGALVVDPALREEVSAVQLELHKQIMVLQQEQQVQQQILLQHFQLQQRHLQEQHEKHLTERIRMYMEHQKIRSDTSTHSDEDRDSGNGSDKETKKSSPHEPEKEITTISSSASSIKCPKKDVLRKLEEEERLRHLMASKIIKGNNAAKTPPSSKLTFMPQKKSNSASSEVRAKLQQFIAKRQEQRSRSNVVTGIQRPRQKSSSSERSTTSSSCSGSESPPAKITPDEIVKKPMSNELNLKLKSILRQKVLEGRVSPIAKTDSKLKKLDINGMDISHNEDIICRSEGMSQELPKQRKNEMFQMISMLLGQ